jgi:long-chain fatty acid transport protein
MRFAFKQVSLIVACLTALPVYATNGYFLPGFGIRSQGMGGVGIAYGRDSLSTAANPANAVNTGMRGDMGFAVFDPERHASLREDPTNTTPGFFSGSVESSAKYFLIPEMGFSMPLSEQLHLALAVVGNGGMNSTYKENFFSFFGNPPRDAKVGVDMMQLLVPVTLAYKVNEHHSLGASLVLAETRFRAYGIQAFIPFNISADNAHLTNQGFDYSYGAGVKLGWLGEFMDDKLTVGLTYASRTYMTKFEKYRGLFAEQGDFDIPESYGIGIAIKPVKNLVIAADVLRINYNDIAAIGNPGPGTNPDGFGPKGGIPALDAGVNCPNNPYCLGNDQGMGFGWNNQTVYKLGVQYGLNNKLQVRAGYNYGKSPIPNNQLTFNTLAPATVEHHYSAGFTYKPNDNLEVTGTYMYVASNNQSACDQNIVDCVSIGMHQNVVGLSLGWVLDPGPKDMEEYGNANWDGIDFTGWYGGFGFGQSKYRDLATTSATTAVNDHVEGWKVYTGYDINKYLGIEGGYANLNDFTLHTTTTRTKGSSDAWTLAAVGSYPLTDKFSVKAKLGAAYVLTRSEVKVGAALTTTTGDDSYQPYYGVGVSYALFDNLNLRADWERFDLDHSNVDLMTAGFAVKF